MRERHAHEAIDHITEIGLYARSKYQMISIAKTGLVYGFGN